MANRAIKIAVVSGVLLVCLAAIAQVAGFKVQWIDYAVQATNPVTAGRRGTYVKTSDDALHYVNSAGTDTAVGAGGSSTLQGAYTASPASAPVAMALDATRKGTEWTPYGGQTTDPLMSFKRDALVTDPYPAVRLYNTTASTGGVPAQVSPSVQYEGRIFDVSNKASVFRTYNNPAIDIAGDTGKFSIDHSLAGGAFSNVLNVVEQTSLGETILSNTGPGANSIFLYPAGPGAGKAFLGVEGAGIKLGPSLISTFRLNYNATAGWAPQNDLIVTLGDDTHRWLSASAGLFKGDATGSGFAAAPATVVKFILSNLDAATNGNQVYSGAMEWNADGFDTAASVHRNANWFMQAQPRQETVAAPTVELKFFSQIVSVTSVRERIRFSSGSVNTDGDGGEIAVAHHAGLGTDPTVNAGAALGSGPTVAVSGTDAGGVLTLTSGTGATSGTVATVDFAAAYKGGATGLAVILTPADSDSSTIGAAVYVQQSATTASQFTITAGSALSSSTEYRWHYWVIGKR